MSKQLKLSIGGKERVLEFGYVWFLKFYGQATGEDPINSTEIQLKPEKQFDFVVNTIYASLQTAYKVEKKAFDFSKSDVEDWVGCESMDFIPDFINRYAELYKSSTTGEAVAPKDGA